MLQNMKSIILLAILHVGSIEANSNIASKFQEKTDIDPKEAFFKHFRFYNSQQLSSESDSESESEFEPEPDPELKQFRNIPLPGGFEFSEFSGSGSDSDNRKFNKDGATKGKYLMAEENDKNHFIRLKRSEDKQTVDRDIETGRQKREPDSEARTKQMIASELGRGADRERGTRGVTKEQWIKQPYPVERTAGQESFDNNDNVPSASASDTIRAPRVHFVTTQRRPLVGGTPIPAPVPVPASSPTVFREREGRSRDRDRDLYPHSYSYPHLYPVPVPLPVYPHPRARSYEPYRPRYYDPYFQHYDDRDRDRERERRYRYGFDVFDDGRSMLPPPPPPPPPPSPLQSKQRRIIYYATLPEVVRNPSSERPRSRPSPADRDRDRQAEQRYSYRSGYNGYNGGYNGYNGHDGRYVHHPESDTDYRSQKQRDHEREYNSRTRTSTNTNTSGGNGSGSGSGSGSGNGNSSPTANTNSNKTPLYPVKVSTDVNVRDREPKKTPERRIYSELDKRFNYKTPDDSNF